MNIPLCVHALFGLNQALARRHRIVTVPVLVERPAGNLAFESIDDFELLGGNRYIGVDDALVALEHRLVHRYCIAGGTAAVHGDHAVIGQIRHQPGLHEHGKRTGNSGGSLGSDRIADGNREQIGGAAFKVDNPQAAAGCGCGSSFGI